MNIGIYIYDNAEVLDLSGPFEVFSTAKRVAKNKWSIFLVAETDTLVKAQGNFLVSPLSIGTLQHSIGTLQSD